jgi:hypothetical protein
MNDPLYNCVSLCHRFISAADSALLNPLTDVENQADDNQEARTQLSRALTAAQMLRDHLESQYLFLNGWAYSNSEEP